MRDTEKQKKPHGIPGHGPSIRAAGGARSAGRAAAHAGLGVLAARGGSGGVDGDVGVGTPWWIFVEPHGGGEGVIQTTNLYFLSSVRSLLSWGWVLRRHDKYNNFKPACQNCANLGRESQLGRQCPFIAVDLSC